MRSARSSLWPVEEVMERNGCCGKRTPAGRRGDAPSTKVTLLNCIIPQALFVFIYPTRLFCPRRWNRNATKTERLSKQRYIYIKKNKNKEFFLLNSLK